MGGTTPFGSIVLRIVAVIASVRRRAGGGAPAAPATPPAANSNRIQPWHITRKGDSIRRIADLYGVSPYLLMVANPQLVPTVGLEAGQSVRIPRAAILGPPPH